MRNAFSLTLLLATVPPAPALPATWYVSSSVPSSGDGSSWQTAFKTIQQGIDAGSDGDTVIVAPGTYPEDVRFKGKNLILTSTNPLDPATVAQTMIDDVGSGPAVAFDGTEDETCSLRGFTLGDGGTDYGGAISGALRSGRTRARIESNAILDNSAWGEGGAIAYCDGVIRNNTIIGNYAGNAGGAIAHCNGLIENNIIMDNSVGGGICSLSLRPGDDDYRIEIRPGGGLYDCDGIIRGNLIVGNKAMGEDYGLWEEQGWGGGLAKCDGVIENNVIWDNCAGLGDGGGLWWCDGLMRNNIIVGNHAENGGGAAGTGVIRNCIVWGNRAVLDDPQLYGYVTYSCIQDWMGGGEGNISEDPRFVDAENGDFRLLPDSPCIDAGFNDPELPETDIAGMHRVMFGGKSLTVDMGAYEFYINDLAPGPRPLDTTFTWSSLAEKTYSIFYTDDLLTWHLAIASFLSSGNQTTSWIDDGSKTGVPPSLIPRRFYRLFESP